MQHTSSFPQGLPDLEPLIMDHLVCGQPPHNYMHNLT